MAAPHISDAVDSTWTEEDIQENVQDDSLKTDTTPISLKERFKKHLEKIQPMLDFFTTGKMPKLTRSQTRTLRNQIHNHSWNPESRNQIHNHSWNPESRNQIHNHSWNPESE